jgi:hypothetical protein
MTEFVKRNPTAPSGFFACEAAGLAWLSSAPGGVRCAQVLGYDDTSLTLEWLRPAPPSAGAAWSFGRRLAITHDAGAPGFGAPPAGWQSAADDSDSAGVDVHEIPDRRVHGFPQVVSRGRWTWRSALSSVWSSCVAARSSARQH